MTAFQKLKWLCTSSLKLYKNTKSDIFEFSVKNGAKLALSGGKCRNIILKRTIYSDKWFKNPQKIPKSPNSATNTASSVSKPFLNDFSCQKTGAHQILWSCDDK